MLVSPLENQILLMNGYEEIEFIPLIFFKRLELETITWTTRVVVSSIYILLNLPRMAIKKKDETNHILRKASGKERKH